MHQLSLLPAALFYYKKALTLGPSVEQAGLYILCKEAFHFTLADLFNH